MKSNVLSNTRIEDALSPEQVAGRLKNDGVISNASKLSASN
jgi:hypothetical protein